MSKMSLLQGFARVFGAKGAEPGGNAAKKSGGGKNILINFFQTPPMSSQRKPPNSKIQGVVSQDTAVGNQRRARNDAPPPTHLIIKVSLELARIHFLSAQAHRMNAKEGG